ncbi:phage tail sheath C-terminal domain-containing protein [Pluralibacter sp.]|jgi:phage tail sheath protein FI|uniref:phage tail sheath family protein n=1 Tax=Pluralibacter sp. TaxID=1920032 RepID=UPI0025E3B147|nr:phage tail sheath C-terminal domain-containing protein [Pluralibacter sp.]MBV8042105.1 phage tail sheath family protein [Pluralibacter sp.]
MGIQQPGVSVTPGTFAVPKLAAESAVPLFIGFTEKQPATLPVYVTTFAEFEAQFGGPHDGNAVLYYTVRHFFDNDGQGGFVYSLSTYNAPPPVTLDIPALSRAIEAEQSITLLAFPDCVMVADRESEQWQDIWQSMLSLCQLRPGLFAVLDAPDTPQAAKQCLTSYNGTHSEWGGVWWPRLVTPYLKNDSPVTVPPSGAVLAAMQQTDSARGVWSAPANVSLAQVTRPAYSWLDAVDLFNPEGASINLIRSFPGRGTRIWGCRTLTSDNQSSFRYVQARRLMSWCETNISNLGRMLVFEPNTELTWYKLKGFTIMWLRELWQQGGLYGEQEPQAYQVLLGLEETMTQEDIQAGKMIMNIRLALLAPAEFIELSLVFMMNGENAA